MADLKGPVTTTFKIEVGNPFIIQCIHLYPVVWIFNRELVSSDKLLDSNIIHISNADPKHSGTYKCRRKYKDSKNLVKKIVREVVVKVTGILIIFYSLIMYKPN